MFYFDRVFVLLRVLDSLPDKGISIFFELFLGWTFFRNFRLFCGLFWFLYLNIIWSFLWTFFFELFSNILLNIFVDFFQYFFNKKSNLWTFFQFFYELFSNFFLVNLFLNFTKNNFSFFFWTFCLVVQHLFHRSESPDGWLFFIIYWNVSLSVNSSTLSKFSRSGSLRFENFRRKSRHILHNFNGSSWTR